MALNASVTGEQLFRVALLPMLLAPIAVALLARMIFKPTMGRLTSSLSRGRSENYGAISMTSSRFYSHQGR
ncbi:hypothetical protein [Bradyrhizobium sp. UFLA05-112]